MPTGRFGLPRPFAVENEEVVIRIPSRREFVEAEVSAQNGFVVRGEIEPFFDITDVKYVNPDGINPATEVYVDVNDDLLRMQDAVLLASNLRQEYDVDFFADEIQILPSISVNRVLAESDRLPKLIVKVETDRGTKQEFEDSINSFVSKLVGNNELLRVEKVEGTNTGFILADGVSVKNIKQSSSVLPGPENKKTEEFFFDVIGVEK